MARRRLQNTDVSQAPIAQVVDYSRLTLPASTTSRPTSATIAIRSAPRSAIAAAGARIYFSLWVGSLIAMCGEVLMTLGLPSEWVSPWVLISDSSIRKNFSASMAAPRSPVFR